MLILGIESSCDDTGASVVEDGETVLSSVVWSQDSVHGRFGGVVPELASRNHISAIVPVVDYALEIAAIKMDDIDGLAVTQGPGLVGSILVGLSFAKAVSFASGVPFAGVNHIEAHAQAAFLREKGEAMTPSPLPLPSGERIKVRGEPGFPFVSLVASGGHTMLLYCKAPAEFRAIGRTLDDAAGEAFDKVAKMLGLGYPGGAAIDRAASAGTRDGFGFTRPLMSKDSLDFSFSGLKTAAMTHIKKFAGAPEGDKLNDFAASFQEAVVDVLVEKSMRALDKTGVKTLVAAGGVACNSRLRERLAQMAEGRGFRLFIPPPRFCSDNGAMIASLGYHLLKKGVRASLDMNAVPSWDGF
ncbi:MAG: tRNA (adenosine(37)-N6)-threonylcarbamoyltransferase complex transferase subunit TsaD [Deltaproteobacteria bacterium]|nr:tRNA (adenosine(37)-N6)-threonylcarbamoyltransferase complex transferase subunit TsaD [Deltaproteobacteria bacterium]